tara:strand:- start:414 stop:1115 length:702 start_codon:yes stop_codon:yes gene_type:complete
MTKYDFTFAHREEGFDEHIEYSIRGYSNLLEDIVNLSKYFVEGNTKVVDIGCSTGKVTRMMIESNKEFCSDATYEGVELAEGFSKPLDNRIKQLEKEYPDTAVKFIKDDIRFYDFYNCSLVTSIFTLQFMPMKDRADVIQKIYNGLNVGGGFIFAEKLLCTNARIQEMMTFNYYDYKRKNFEPKDIMDKEKTLRHMLKPNSWSQIKDMILSAGFQDVQCFWSNHMFVGAVAIK